MSQLEGRKENAMYFVLSVGIHRLPFPAWNPMPTQNKENMAPVFLSMSSNGCLFSIGHLLTQEDYGETLMANRETTIKHDIDLPKKTNEESLLSMSSHRSKRETIKDTWLDIKRDSFGFL